MDEHEISDDEIAAFLEQERRRRYSREHGPIASVSGGQSVSKHDDKVEELWAALHDTERRLADTERRLSWAFRLVSALAVALGITELSLTIHSLPWH